MAKQWEIPTALGSFTRTLYLTTCGTLLLTAKRMGVETVSLSALLTRPFLGKPAAVQPILMELCRKLPLDAPAQPQARTLYAFYRHLNLQLVPTREFEWGLSLSSRREEPKLAELTPQGFIEWITNYAGARQQNSMQLLGDLLVMGPTIPGMPLTMRRQLRQLLLAVTPGSELTVADAFPLLDHDRMPTLRRDYNETPNSGEYLEMSPGAICIGGWSEPGHQGGAQYHSPESLLCNPHAFEHTRVPLTLQAEVKSILADLVIP